MTIKHKLAQWLLKRLYILVVAAPLVLVSIVFFIVNIDYILHFNFRSNKNQKDDSRILLCNGSSSFLLTKVRREFKTTSNGKHVETSQNQMEKL